MASIRIWILMIVFMSLNVSAEVQDVYGIWEVDAERQFESAPKGNLQLTKEEYVKMLKQSGMTIEIREEKLRVLIGGEENAVIIGRLQKIDGESFDFSGTTWNPLEDRVDKRSMPMLATIKLDKDGKAHMRFGTREQMGAPAFMIKVKEK